MRGDEKGVPIRFACLALIPGFFSGACSDRLRIEESGTSVSAVYRGEVLWRYHHNPAEGKPYFHPLRSTGGMTFTGLRPEDHPWHRGLWFSWKYINGVNYWEENRQTGLSPGRTRIVKFQSETDQMERVELDLEIEYGPAGREEVVLREMRRVRVAPPDSEGAYTVDWSGRFEAVAGDVTLDRTPLAHEPNGKTWGGYAGWSVRMNQDMEGGVFVNDGGKEGADRAPADWMLFRMPGMGSLLLMDHPGNLNFPAKWYLNPEMPFFNPAVLHDGPHTIRAGESLNLRYRLVVAAREWNVEDARRAWDAWLLDVE